MLTLKSLLTESTDDLDIFSNAPKSTGNSSKDFSNMEKYQQLLNIPDNVSILSKESSSENNSIAFDTSVPIEIYYADNKHFKVNPLWIIEKLKLVFGSNIGRGLISTSNGIVFNSKELKSKVTINDLSTGYWSIIMDFPLNVKVTPRAIKTLNDKITKALESINEKSDYKELFQKQFGADWWKYYDQS